MVQIGPPTPRPLPRPFDSASEPDGPVQVSPAGRLNGVAPQPPRPASLIEPALIATDLSKRRRRVGCPWWSAGGRVWKQVGYQRLDAGADLVADGVASAWCQVPVTTNGRGRRTAPWLLTGHTPPR